MKNCDALIVGGGPAGAACAAGLARHGLRPMVIARTTTRGRFCETLSPEAVEDLRCRSIFPELDESSFMDCRGISVVDGTGRERFESYLGNAGFGLTVEKSALVNGLLDIAAEAGAEILFDAELSAQPNSTHWDCLIHKHGETEHVRARFVVESTGRSPAAGLGLTIPRVYFDRTVAAITQVAGDPVRPNVMTLQTCPESWIYATGMPGGGKLIVVVTDADVLSRAGHREIFLADQLAAVARENFGARETNSGWSMVDARTSCRKILWMRRWLAIGDAAFTSSPLSGHGIHQAVRHGLAAAEAIHHSLHGNDFSNLEKFALWTIGCFNREADLGVAAHHLLRPASRESFFWGRRLGKPSLPLNPGVSATN